MRIHTIIPASFEKPGIIENWVVNNRHDSFYSVIWK
jgi:hypothetical protein